MPSGSFAANSAWLAAIAFNLTRAAGAVASVFHTKATTATIRRQLIAVPGRLARSARRLVIHLPQDWPWQDSWEGLFNAACGPPTPAAIEASILTGYSNARSEGYSRLAKHQGRNVF